MKLPPDQGFLCQERNNRADMALPQRSWLQKKFQFSTGVLRTVWEVRKETKRHSTVSARRGPEVTRLGGQPDDGHPAPACRWPGSTLPCFSHPHFILPLSPHSPTLEKNKTTSLYEVPKLGTRGGQSWGGVCNPAHSN